MTTKRLVWSNVFGKAYPVIEHVEKSTGNGTPAPRLYEKLAEFSIAPELEHLGLDMLAKIYPHKQKEAA